MYVYSVGDEGFTCRFVRKAGEHDIAQMGDCSDRHIDRHIWQSDVGCTAALA